MNSLGSIVDDAGTASQPDEPLLIGHTLPLRSARRVSTAAQPLGPRRFFHKTSCNSLTRRPPPVSSSPARRQSGAAPLAASRQQPRPLALRVADGAVPPLLRS